MHAPPRIREHVEDAKHNNEECAGPFGFEADGDEGAGCETEDGDEEAGDGPLALDNEAEEKEDEEDATGKEEAGANEVWLVRWFRNRKQIK